MTSRRRDIVTPWRPRLRAGVANASLRVRVMAAAGILVAVTSLATGVLGTTLLRDYLLNRADTQLQDFACIATRILVRSQEPVPRGGVRQGLPTQFLLEVVAPDGRIQVEGDPLSPAAALRLSAAQLAHTAVPFTVQAGNPAHSWRVIVESLPGGRRAVIAFSLNDLSSTVTRLEVADALAGIVAVALLAGIGVPLVRASLGPLQRIEATAAAIAAGDLSQRIDHPSTRTEVGRLASALNSMLSRIETAYQAREEGEARALSSEERMRQFVADASHELRTPLTSLRGLAEYALQQGTQAGPDELLRLVGLVQHEAAGWANWSRTCSCWLSSTWTVPSSGGQSICPVSRRNQSVPPAVVQPDRPVTLSAPNPVIAWADDGRVRQVIDNLIGNALQHTPPGSPVTVTVTSSLAEAQITVADRGPGMTPEQAAHVFERFYRTDRARARSRGGAGLGLSIAAALAASHGGRSPWTPRPGGAPPSASRCRSR